jgi:hypothetical protein
MNKPMVGFPSIVRRCALLAALFSPLLAACGADSAAGEAPTDSALGENERFIFTVEAERPPSAGANGFRLVLRDAAEGEPIRGASVDVYALMRSMGHDDATAAVKELESGAYEVLDLILTMPGLWEIRYRASLGATTDEAAFLYDIP